MRKIYWAIAFLWVPFQMGAQDGVAWHNQGEASSTGDGQTTMHIGGNIKFSNQAGSTQTPEMGIAGSRIRLTGNFINDVARGNLGGTLFNPGIGGVFEFCGTTPQSVTTSGTDNTELPSKRLNFIDFPKLVINNNKHVTLNARLAAQTQDIDLQKGWLILDSDKAKADVDGEANDVDENNESVLAHLLVKGNVTYLNRTAADMNDRGFIQVNLKLENETTDFRSIVGFGSPFNELYADYFMFNTLTRPVPAGFLKNGMINDPKTLLEAGRGHVVGIDLMGNTEENYAPFRPNYEGINFAKRAKDGYEFNRSLFHDRAPENEVFGGNASQTAYTGEMLNTGNVSVPLEVGYNYLANPYTCPLNIDQLLGENQASLWGVKAGSLDPDPDVWNNVWILNTNSGASYNKTTNKIKYSYNYQVAMKGAGGTYIGEDEEVAGETPIAPLQMFMIYSYKKVNITIPEEARIMSATRFLRNAPVINKRKDDFIVEFRNKETKTTDRMSFVLRPQSELASFGNVTRLANKPGDDDKTALVYDGITQNLSSQLYTKDASGEVLTVQFFPLETTDIIQLYHIPPLVEQDLQVLGRRIATKEQVETMWLEDKLTNTVTEITPEMVYETTSKPGDPVDRFIIRLKSQTSIEGETGSVGQAIYAYTQDGNIIVQGFSEQDYGRKVELYDLNGRLLAQKTAGEPSLVLYRGYQPGVYLIKTYTGKTQSIKLIAH